MRFKRNRGLFYVRVFGAKDLKGETEFTARNAAMSKVFKTKYDAQWVEYALGINYRLSRKSYFYADVERTSGGDVKENYRWNAGVRFMW